MERGREADTYLLRGTGTVIDGRLVERADKLARGNDNIIGLSEWKPNQLHNHFRHTMYRDYVSL